MYVYILYLFGLIMLMLLCIRLIKFKMVLYRTNLEQQFFENWHNRSSVLCREPAKPTLPSAKALSRAPLGKGPSEEVLSAAISLLRVEYRALGKVFAESPVGSRQNLYRGSSWLSAKKKTSWRCRPVNGSLCREPEMTKKIFLVSSFPRV